MTEQIDGSKPAGRKGLTLTILNSARPVRVWSSVFGRHGSPVPQRVITNCDLEANQRVKMNSRFEFVSQMKGDLEFAFQFPPFSLKTNDTQIIQFEHNNTNGGNGNSRLAGLNLRIELG